MGQHDPFKHIFEFLEMNNQLNNLDELERKVIEIHDTFSHNDFKSYNYPDSSFQAGYLIFYYPLYIDPIDYILSHVPDGELGWIDKPKLTISIYGGGPEPELLGFLKFVHDKYPNILTIFSTYYDVHNWQEFRKYCYIKMIREYWPEKSFKANSIFLDLSQDLNNGRNFRTIHESDVHIMQNCATDLMNQLGEISRYHEFISNFFKKLKSGAILIIIDNPLFNTPLQSTPTEIIDIRRSLQQITFHNQQYGSIIKNVSSGSPTEITPKIVRNHPLLSRFRLKERVKFHSIIMKRGG